MPRTPACFLPLPTSHQLAPVASATAASKAAAQKTLAGTSVGDPPAECVVTDQPGRWAAVFCVAPLLLWCGLRVMSSFEAVGWLLCSFASIFLVYEVFWLCSAEPPKVATVRI